MRLYKKAEEAKRGISDQTAVTMELMLGEENKTAEITLKEYEEECEELLMKIREPVKKSLADAGLKLSDIDEVLLIGGATRLSVVRDFLIRLFRKFPDTRLNPDEAVALGAAIQAAMKERREEVKEVILTDVCSFTLGTEVVVEYEEGKFEDGRFCPIIERNTVIPASHTERLYTVRDNQDKVRVRVLQGESRFARNNLFLGELNIDVPKGPRGSEAVDVTYTYDINSLLEVEVKVVSTGLTQKMIIKGQDNQMTDDEIQKRMTDSRCHKSVCKNAVALDDKKLNDRRKNRICDSGAYRTYRHVFCCRKHDSENSHRESTGQRVDSDKGRCCNKNALSAVKTIEYRENMSKHYKKARKISDKFIVMKKSHAETVCHHKSADNYRKHALCKIAQQRCRRRAFSEYSQNIGQTCVVASVITDILML